MSDRLTPATARLASAGAVLYDHEVVGLHLRCTPTRKSWLLYYRTRDGRERRPALGTYPEMSLSAARDVARQIKADVAAGRDPSGAWQARRTAPTVDDLCARYLDWAEPRKAQSSIYEDRRMITTYIRPGLGRMRVADVTLDDVDAFLGDVQARRYTRTGHADKASAPGTRNRVRALLGKMFTLARDRLQWRSDHPVKGSELARTPGRRRLVPPDELVRIVDALRAYPHHAPMAERADRAVTGIWLLLLTGARPGEIAGLRRRDWQGDHILLLQHKTARAIGAKRIPLPAVAQQMLAALDERHRFGPDEPMITSHVERVWRKVRIAADARDLQLRDLRKAFASYALASGVTLDQIGDLYGHTSTQTTRGYAWLQSDARHAVAERVAATLLAIGDKPRTD